MIKNVSVIAHINHGKSTLVDRIIEYSGYKIKHAQFLDNLSVERARGITVKAQATLINYKNQIINIIDTPGHVDFTSEVERSLVASSGVLLLVDATQGIQAQTVAHIYAAMQRNLPLIPILNKVDLPSADIERISDELNKMFGINKDDIILVSAKTGFGIQEMLDQILKKIPDIISESDKSLQCLILDSNYDSYAGSIFSVYVYQGTINLQDTVYIMPHNNRHKVHSLGVWSPEATEQKSLFAGQVGYMSCGIKDISGYSPGSLITHSETTEIYPELIFQSKPPVVFCSIFPIDSTEFDDLRVAITKLNLNDPSFTYEIERSDVFGIGFRCGFLGLLHLEVIEQRLFDEFNQEITITKPSVSYKVQLKTGEEQVISNPALLPKNTSAIYEPWVLGIIFVLNDYIGNIMTLCKEKRGILVEQETLGIRSILRYEFPLSEIVSSFYDKLKDCSKGYASFEYTHLDYRLGNLVKLDISINDDIIHSLASITPKEFAYEVGKRMCEILSDKISRQQVQIAIRAQLDSKIIASEIIKPYRKDVTAKCYGRHRERKMKLLDIQKKGKKKMSERAQNTKIYIPNSAYIAVLN